MTEFTFYLSDKDTERLFAIKDLQGADNMTGNEFARQLLEAELCRLFPDRPKYNEAGQLINADKYRPRGQISKPGGRKHE